MIRAPSAVTALFTLLLVSAPGAMAAVVLSGVTFTPPGPLSPGEPVLVTVHYAVIPPGFPRGHSLQLETDLNASQWIIQVSVDGRDAARQTGSGSVVFLSGELLAYPDNRDVGITMTVNGSVPSGASGNLSVLRLRELDNNGHSVPGSLVAVYGPVTGPSAAPVPVQTTLPGSSVPTTKAPGFALTGAVLSLTTVYALRRIL